METDSQDTLLPLFKPFGEQQASFRRGAVTHKPRSMMNRAERRKIESRRFRKA